MSGPNGTRPDLFWQDGQVTRAERERSRGHRGATVWFTGLSASGKTTLARALEAELFRRGVAVYVLDGDNIRHGLNRDLGFSPEDRTENIRRIGEVARLFTDFGAIVLTAFISPYRGDRDAVRTLLADGDFFEVFVDAPLRVCEARDPKGLYRKARCGAIAEFTGISAPYEPPTQPELTLPTDRLPVAACVASLLRFLEERGVIPVAGVDGAAGPVPAEVVPRELGSPA
jgi:adenylylsulfate kinase